MRKKIDIPEVGTGAGCRNSAGWGDGGCCMPAATAHQAAAVDRNASCSRAVEKVVAEVEAALGFGRSWRCREVVGRGWLGGEEGSSGHRCSSRLLPFWRMCCSTVGIGMISERVCKATRTCTLYTRIR